MLISKINFLKNIILICFQVKKTLKINLYRIFRHALRHNLKYIIIIYFQVKKTFENQSLWPT